MTLPVTSSFGTELLAKLPGALFLVDLDDVIVFANQACRALLGGSLDKPGVRVSDVLMGDGDVLDWAALSQRARQDHERSATIVMLGQLPPPRPATLALQYVQDAGGFTGFLCTLESRGENEQLLAWLKTLEQTYSFLLERTQDVYFTLAFVPRVAFTFVSPAIERLAGYRPVRFYGDPDLRFSLFHPDDKPLLTSLYDGLLATDTPLPMRLLTRDGSRLSVELRCQVQRDEEGRPLSLEAVMRDVTHQMRTEDHLRASEERFRLLFEHSMSGQYLFTLDGRIRDINAVALGMFGFLRSDVLGRYIFDLPSVPASEHEVIRRVLEALRCEGQCEPFELTLLRSDGTPVVSEVNTVVVPVGEELLIYGTLRDVTARKEAELRLAESRELLRVAMETSAVSLFLLDPRGVLKLFGGGGFAKLGWTAESVQGRSIFAMAAPYDEIIQCVRSALDGAVARRLVRVPGQETVIEIHCSPFQNREAQLVGVLGVAVDVTERVRAEEALAESKRQLEAILATVQAGILLVDRESHRIRDVNETALQMMQRTREDVLGRLCFGLFGTPENPTHCPLEKHDSHTMQNAEVFLHLPDGTTRPVLKSVALFTYQGRPHLLESFVDITERRQAQEKQRQLETQIMNAQRMESLAKLAGGIAHDFNNLLTAVIGNLSLVMMDMPRESELYQCMSEIDTAAKQAAELSLQMLAYSGQSEFTIAPLDIASLLADLEPLALASVPEEATLEWRPPSESLSVNGDANWLRTAVLNLVVNAGEALPNKRGSVRVGAGSMMWSQESAAPGYMPDPLANGRYAYIEVRDEGGGMEATAYPLIFDPFFSTKFTGRGLGLAAVLGIMRGHQGGVWVHSERGHGSVIRLLLPLREAGDAA